MPLMKSHLRYSNRSLMRGVCAYLLVLHIRLRDCGAWYTYIAHASLEAPLDFNLSNSTLNAPYVYENPKCAGV